MWRSVLETNKIVTWDWKTKEIKNIPFKDKIVSGRVQTWEILLKDLQLVNFSPCLALVTCSQELFSHTVETRQRTTLVTGWFLITYPSKKAHFWGMTNWNVRAYSTNCTLIKFCLVCGLDGFSWLEQAIITFLGFGFSLFLVFGG